MKLTEEQDKVIALAKSGVNVKVEACIGSGKTTVIQELCRTMPSRNILYLTFNKLLKSDARDKIKCRNTHVTNYHGYAFELLNKQGIKVDINDLIRKFIQLKPADDKKYDMLVVDEYQDIDSDIAKMLEVIKENNQGIQIIMVGDICQKIYDWSTLDVTSFVNDFLGVGHEVVEFTKCFRLNSGWAGVLGKIWGKPIIGVNSDCLVEDMDFETAIDVAAHTPVKDILCLGGQKGAMITFLNTLEERFPKKFNKGTVYCSVQEANRVAPDAKAAIMCTYDKSKGMERDVCFVFGFTPEYLASRLNKPNINYDIVKNLFCVAASRGKKHIIFVGYEGDRVLTADDFIDNCISSEGLADEYYIDNMFSYKHKEHIEEAYRCLNVMRFAVDETQVISACENDGLIDLSPCMEIYFKSQYFNNFNFTTETLYQLGIHAGADKLVERIDEILSAGSNDHKVRMLTTIKTGQYRYNNQVAYIKVSPAQREKMNKRLSVEFSSDEIVQRQVVCIATADERQTLLTGMVDVMKDDMPYTLRYADSLSHEDCLVAAMYVMATKSDKGVLWNIKTNEKVMIKIKDREQFLKTVIKTITKGAIIL